MNHIIGTAGHVDHGKTAVIKSLTGILTTHLPQEHDRGMTIDLGFAHFKTAAGQVIGVIDVPGHERFIRNMVAGTWSLSAVLLVVAADEGWMPMSEDHLRVVHAMGIENIFLVINKIDKVDKDTQDLAIMEAKERCQAILGHDVDTVCVSAHSGQGMDQLRNMVSSIALTDGRPSLVPNGQQCLLYVDRSFVVTGKGRIVTGSLVGGPLEEGQVLRLHPSGGQVRIKGIQSHYTGTRSIQPVCRVALNIGSGKKVNVERGMCLAHESTPILNSDDILVRITQFDLPEKIKQRMGIEIASGTFHEYGTMQFTGRHFARIILEKPVPFLRFQQGLIIRHGGSSILAGFQFIDDQAHKRQRRQRILAMWQGTLDKDIKATDFEFMLNGYAKHTGPPSADRQKDHVHIKGWLLTTEKWNELKTGLLTLAKDNPGGFAATELPPDLSRLPTSLRDAVLTALVKSGDLILSGELYLTSDSSELSPSAKKILDLAIQADLTGIEIHKISIAGAAKEVRRLTRLNLLVHLEGQLFYSTQAFEQVVSKILAGKNPGDQFSIADARQAVGLSRKYIVPVLNAMEERGLVYRQGDVRVVNQILSTECHPAVDMD